MKRSPIKKSRGVRRGRITDKPYLAWIHTMPCILRGRHICDGPVTAHHVRSFGSAKDDTRTLPMCPSAHLHDFGKFSIERLGKRKFEQHWHVDIEGEISRLRLICPERRAA